MVVQPGKRVVRLLDAWSCRIREGSVVQLLRPRTNRPFPSEVGPASKGRDRLLPSPPWLGIALAFILGGAGCRDSSERPTRTLHPDPELPGIYYVPANASRFLAPPPEKILKAGSASLIYVLHEPYPATEYLAGMARHFEKYGWFPLEFPLIPTTGYSVAQERDGKYVVRKLELPPERMGVWTELDLRRCPRRRQWQGWWTDGEERAVNVFLTYYADVREGYVYMRLYRPKAARPLIEQYIAKHGRTWERAQHIVTRATTSQFAGHGR